MVASERGRVTEPEVVQDQALLLPFTMVASGIGYDGERPFFALVIVHDDASMIEASVDRLLTRIRNVTPAGIRSGLTDEWSFLVDRIDVQVSGRFLIARVYLNQPFYAVLLNAPNTLLVHE